MKPKTYVTTPPLHLTPETVAWVNDYAASQHLSRQEVIRRAIDAGRADLEATRLPI